MARSDDILERLEDMREALKYEIMKVAIAKRGIFLGAIVLTACCVLGPASLIPEALAIVGGISGGAAFVIGSSFSLYYLFAEDWRVNGDDVNHRRAVKSLRRRITRLETDYNEALSKETGNK